MTTGHSHSICIEAAAQESSALNKLELTSIYALLAYAAHERNISEEIIRETVTKHFGVDEVTQLPSRSYDEVIRFLVDAQIKIILN